MIWCPEKYKKHTYEKIHEELMDLKGELNDFQGKVTLAKFLKANIGLTVELLTGIKLIPYQEIILKGWLNRNFNMGILTRGGSKTFMAAVYCIIKPAFFSK